MSTGYFACEIEVGIWLFYLCRTIIYNFYSLCKSPYSSAVPQMSFEKNKRYLKEQESYIQLYVMEGCIRQQILLSPSLKNLQHPSKRGKNVSQCIPRFSSFMALFDVVCYLQWCYLTAPFPLWKYVYTIQIILTKPGNWSMQKRPVIFDSQPGSLFTSDWVKILHHQISSAYCRNSTGVLRLNTCTNHCQEPRNQPLPS